ncbi:MAG: DUF4235 domain-containing protein [Ilumatobacteraceae bacterium]
MESVRWKMVSVASGALAALAMRQLVAALWPGRHNPPLNPADRRIDWGEALAWSLASGVGAGIARLVSTRLAAGGWEKATGHPPPGIKPDRSPL